MNGQSGNQFRDIVNLFTVINLESLIGNRKKYIVHTITFFTQGLKKGSLGLQNSTVTFSFLSLNAVYGKNPHLQLGHGNSFYSYLYATASRIDT